QPGPKAQGGRVIPSSPCPLDRRTSTPSALHQLETVEQLQPPTMADESAAKDAAGLHVRVQSRTMSSYQSSTSIWLPSANLRQARAPLPPPSKACRQRETATTRSRSTVAVGAESY